MISLAIIGKIDIMYDDNKHGMAAQSAVSM